MKTLVLLLMLVVHTPDDSLVETGRALKVRSIMTGQQHPILQAEAEAHAAYQAKIHRQGHFWWDALRFPRIRPQFPGCHEFAEVVNESWPGQDEEAAAKEMYRSWKTSPGHWSAVDGPCVYWGFAMIRSDNGVWYSCAIFAQ